MSRSIFTGNKSYFPCIDKIPYEGARSDNPLAFKFYDAKRKVGDKTMAEHLRFSVCYWHTFCGTGSDPFGPGTRQYDWDKAADPISAAMQKLDAAFEFFSKLGVDYYCFHDRDMVAEGSGVSASENNLRVMVEAAHVRQRETGIKLLWGTANLFSHPRYMNGGATNPDFHVLCHSAAQVKAMLDATVYLGGENYVFWGGREGYSCLQNTDTRRELDHFGQFLRAARDYGRSIGFKGSFLIEPKPMEPMYHQYDADAQTVIGFLREQGLEQDFKLNIEANHATLAGHTFAHELQMCVDNNMLGSVDANRGNPQNGWDTDQFPTDIYDAVHGMMVILGAGGFSSGGLNFDAKIRRESTNLEDLFIAHIGAMDTYALGLEIAHDLLHNSPVQIMKTNRYSSFDSGNGKKFEQGSMGLAELAALASNGGEPLAQSGQQELMENIINQYILRR